MWKLEENVVGGGGGGGGGEGEVKVWGGWIELMGREKGRRITLGSQTELASPEDEHLRAEPHPGSVVESVGATSDPTT